jgi:hypothetical protein
MQMKVQGNKLIIEVDVAADTLKKALPSSSGKSRVVATTHGFIGVDGAPVRVSLNVITR